MISQAELVDDLKTLNQIAQNLNRSIHVHDVLQQTLEQLLQLMGLETGWIFVRDPLSTERWSGPGFRLVAVHNLPPGLALDEGEVWNKGCACQTLCLEGVLTQAYNEVQCSRLAEATGERHGLAIHASTPLRSGENVLGILNVAAEDWTAFNERGLALLTTVGSQIGIALERARLFEMVQEQRIHEQAALLDLTNQLLSQPDLDKLLDTVVEEVRKLLQVDAAAVLLVEQDAPYLRFRAASGWRSKPVENAYRVPLETTNSGKVMRTQQPLLIEDTADYPPIGGMMGWLQAEGFRSAAIMPLVTQGRSIGTLVIDTRELRRFSETEVRFLRLMANQAALAIEKARLQREEIRRYRMEEELNVGRQIQLSMLPKTFPTAPGWEFAAVYEAANQVGGDFYDIFQLPGEAGRLGVVIADVSDKGVPAALFMALSRTTLRNQALRGRSPAEALVLTNRYIQEDSRSDMFLSAFYGVLETRNGRFIFSNAGHNWPLWRRAADGRVQPLTTAGIVLGVLDEIELGQREVDLQPGDCLVLYTDGLTEALNEAEEEFGRERLATAVSDILTARPDLSAQEVVDALLVAVRAFTGDVALHDDITLCVVKWVAE